VRRTALFVLSLALALPSIAQADAPADERCFVSAVSLERSRARVMPLTRDTRLDTIARNHSNEMAARETIYHNPNVGTEIGAYEYAGENVGMGPDCETIHAAFMASTGHRENILDPDYQRIGVGVAFGSDETLYVTEVFFTPKPEPPMGTPKTGGTPKESPPCRCPN
jgi:uncharacterized protein YkwD